MKRSTVAVAVIALCTLVACTSGPAPTAGPETERPIRITLVEILTSETFPLQLAIHVQGEPPAAGCWTYPVSPEPERGSDVITLTITSRLQSAACTATPWRYDATFQLGNDFATGEYTLWVNSVEQGFHFDSGFGP